MGPERGKDGLQTARDAPRTGIRDELAPDRVGVEDFDRTVSPRAGGDEAKVERLEGRRGKGRGSELLSCPTPTHMSGERAVQRQGSEKGSELLSCPTPTHMSGERGGLTSPRGRRGRQGVVPRGA